VVGVADAPVAVPFAGAVFVGVVTVVVLAGAVTVVVGVVTVVVGAITVVWWLTVGASVVVVCSTLTDSLVTVVLLELPLDASTITTTTSAMISTATIAIAAPLSRLL